MSEVIQSETIKKWLAGLKDRQARARILARLDRLSLGSPGDVKPAREDIRELRIDYGPGYRVYFIQRILLLAGGDKRTQNADIEQAIEIARTWRN